MAERESQVLWKDEAVSKSVLCSPEQGQKTPVSLQ